MTTPSVLMTKVYIEIIDFSGSGQVGSYAQPRGPTIAVLLVAFTATFQLSGHAIILVLQSYDSNVGVTIGGMDRKQDYLDSELLRHVIHIDGEHDRIFLIPLRYASCLSEET